MTNDPSSSYVVPVVIENGPKGERSFDLWSRLMRDRVIFIGGAIDSHVANLIVAQLLFLESESSEKPINVYINSPGGEIAAGLAIYDTMQYIKAPVHTTCLGMAASMGAFLLAAGHTGQRRILPHSEVMIHQPLGGAQGQATDMEIAMRRMQRLKESLTRLMAENVGKDYEQVLEDCERDNWLTADQALEYGLVDEVIPATRPAKMERDSDA